ncbi:MAG: sensor histidine kinase [Hyphomicrobiales bacterium]
MPPARKLYRSAAFRLSLLYMALFAAAAALSIGYIYWNTNVLLGHQLEQTIDAEIQGLAEQYRSGGIVRLAETVASRSRTPGNSLYLVADDAGQPLVGNLVKVSPDLLNSIGQQVEFTYARPGQHGAEDRLALARVFRLPGGYRLIVGRDIEDRRKFENVFSSAIVVGLGVMVLVGLIGAWLVSRSLLARVEAVAATSRTIMSGDLTGRVPVRGTGDELDRLAESLNLMLERIEQLMNGLREVSDNIAHDLKTPLNRLRNRVEAALREDGGAPAYRSALEDTIEEADDLIKTFNALLSIARLEAGATGGSMEEVDVSGLLRDVSELYAPVAEEEGLELRIDAPEVLGVVGERELIGQAVANLIDNAIKYSAPAGTAGEDDRPREIVVSAGEASGRVEIAVADRGPGIPPQDRERAMRRFVRLEASRSRPGSGLGLSLVAAVARLHQGEIRLEDNAPGLRAVLSLPKQAGRDGTGQ